MRTTRVRSFAYRGILAAGFAVLLSASLAIVGCQRPAGDTVSIDSDDLGGVVSGANGPEAGVWVIAETTDLPTKFVKIVVTDDSGRYLLPDLPSANYAVWVRGYGLVDSSKVEAEPGNTVNLTAVVAPNAAAAAQYYPAGYWYSLLHAPDESEFPGTGPEGNGISPNIKNQSQWLRNVKSGSCTACHQLGNKATREIPDALGSFPSSQAAWERRILSGQAGGSMAGGFARIGTKAALEAFADWTDRVAAGEVPEAPPRPQGLERNVVITQWDWADPKAYLHDQVSTDRRDPTLNADGLIYGALEASADYLPVLDPVSHSRSEVKLTVRDPETPPAAQQTWRSLRRTGAMKPSGIARTTCTIRCSMSWAAFGSPRRCVRAPTRTFAKRVRATHRPSCSHWIGPAVTWPSTIRNPKSSHTSAPASARIT